MTVATADLYDELGDGIQSLPLQLRSFGRRRAFDGPIRTVRCLEDNALVKSLLATPGDGAVLVIDGGGSLNTALMGDLIAASAVQNGWAGVVINGGIRDSVAIDGLDLGVKALGTNPRKSAKLGAGEVDVTVSFGGVEFAVGAHLYSDEDGILVERLS
ncbi:MULTISPECIES: ribonuclease E activity regulator RraA [unclassified Microbacterium]|uniref:ribonuclease E activity regulator RraA n=1 Tax=unclassified Microbacterium TaxID=2609290 RepID=UPI000CFA863E|nr:MULTISPECIES: ribonuclease E activity regulator RraA [unclassified Microbacterium]PRB11912.1 S-adenosylmethionine--2-demethylmenaquinone methyltransferase [Microbacterium sp. MYb72]